MVLNGFEMKRMSKEEMREAFAANPMKLSIKEMETYIERFVAKDEQDDAFDEFVDAATYDKDDGSEGTNTAGARIYFFQKYFGIDIRAKKKPSTLTRLQQRRADIAARRKAAAAEAALFEQNSELTVLGSNGDKQYA